MIRNPVVSLCSLFVAALLAAPTHGAVIYQDDFSGDGLSSLNGAAPDVAPGTETWASGSHLLNNGVQDGLGQFTALLPFTPQAGAGLYTFSAEFTNVTSNWLAMGFTEELGDDLEHRWLNGGDGADSHPALWALVNPLNAAGAGSAQSFLGYPAGQTAGPGNHTWHTSLVITIDTTNPDWEVTWDFDGDGVDRTATVLAANVPDISYVGFSSNPAAGTAHVTSMTLEGPAVPEPSTMILLLAMTTGAALCRTRP